MTVPAGPASAVDADLITREDLQRALAERDVALVMGLAPPVFARSHIPGSRNYESYEALAADLSPDGEIVVYCTDENCRASRYAPEALRQRGFRRVRRYAGGMSDWVGAGLPVDTGEARR
ncbi:rhodanese-like domain-containing protein [Blastococcus sp. VKM Ac-2987]|uniref:rhodanese-like domain-containing protein n=1 Tax=Blastococcus sp. VKM Ac-2987 TaxID=3004141 RepID=UPI0022AB7EF9|nr:rhodanese-like domain-containing protein [Blastococcus sp. VKM Ac-2987]MCZ2860838.1 rhodanese-like domain-containing protein [Blastococcus sp. VKM Ac-2987]